MVPSPALVGFHPLFVVVSPIFVFYRLPSKHKCQHHAGGQRIGVGVTPGTRPAKAHHVVGGHREARGLAVDRQQELGVGFSGLQGVCTCMELILQQVGARVEFYNNGCSFFWCCCWVCALRDPPQLVAWQKTFRGSCCRHGYGRSLRHNSSRFGGLVGFSGGAVVGTARVDHCGTTRVVSTGVVGFSGLRQVDERLVLSLSLPPDIPHRVVPHRTALYRTAPHSTAPHRTVDIHLALFVVFRASEKILRVLSSLSGFGEHFLHPSIPSPTPDYIVAISSIFSSSLCFSCLLFRLPEASRERRRRPRVRCRRCSTPRERSRPRGRTPAAASATVGSARDLSRRRPLLPRLRRRRRRRRQVRLDGGSKVGEEERVRPASADGDRLSVCCCSFKVNYVGYVPARVRGETGAAKCRK